jgi:predicted nucleotidyltransferase
MVAVDDDVKRRAVSTAEAFGRAAPVRAAFLFGSHAEGRTHEWSDIDIAVFLEGLESWRLRDETRLVVEVQKEMGFDIEPHLFPASRLNDAPRGSFAQYVVNHGIPLPVGDRAVEK